MGPVSHFLFGALCGAVVACVALLFRRRWALYAPPFILACGFWGEMPWLLGAEGARHWAANVFFGYAWLHPSVGGGGFLGFFLFLVVANVLLVGYVVFLTWYFWTVDTVRWEHGGWRKSRHRTKRRRSEKHRSKE